MAALLDVKNLGISFGGLRAVNGFDISIEQGELYGLIGPNGAGKTTVFNLLTGVYKPDTGKIVLDGRDITGKKTIDISKAGIARTFQNIRLFKQLSVLDNVKAGLHNHHKYSAIEGVLRLPRYFKVEKEMNERALELLKVFELEEPAAGMNPNETGSLMEMIQLVREKFHMTILLIEHDMKLVSGICEKLTVLNFGEVLAQGKTAEVLNDPQVITAYLGE